MREKLSTMAKSGSKASIALLPVDEATARLLTDPTRASMMAKIVMRIAATWDGGDPRVSVLDTEIELSIVAEREIFGLTTDQADALRGHATDDSVGEGQADRKSSVVAVHEILAALARVMGSWSRAREWLFRPHPALSSRPIDLLATSDGAIKVALAIIRAECSIDP